MALQRLIWMEEVSMEDEVGRMLPLVRDERLGMRLEVKRIMVELMEVSGEQVNLEITRPLMEILFLLL